VPCLVAGALSSLAGILAWLLLPARSSRSASVDASADGTTERVDNNPVNAPERWLFIAQFGFHTCAVSAAVYLFPLWMAHDLSWQAREVGLFFGLVGLVMVITQGNLLGRMTDRFGPLRVLRGAALCFSVSLALSSVASGEWFMGALGLMVFSAATLCLPILNTIASHLVGPASRGRFFGITASSAALGRIVGPLIAAMLLSQGGFSAAWMGTSAVVLMVVVWAFTLGRQLPTTLPEGDDPAPGVSP